MDAKRIFHREQLNSYIKQQLAKSMEHHNTHGRTASSASEEETDI